MRLKRCDVGVDQLHPRPHTKSEMHLVFSALLDSLAPTWQGCGSNTRPRRAVCRCTVLKIAMHLAFAVQMPPVRRDLDDWAGCWSPQLLVRQRRRVQKLPPIAPTSRAHTLRKRTNPILRAIKDASTPQSTNPTGARVVGLVVVRLVREHGSGGVGRQMLRSRSEKTGVAPLATALRPSLTV